MWLASTCCTTVGYGNFVPTTDGAKIFLVFYSPIAIGCFAKMMGFIASQVLRAARWTLVHTCLKDPVQQVTLHRQTGMILSGGKAPVLRSRMVRSEAAVTIDSVALRGAIKKPGRP